MVLYFAIIVCSWLILSIINICCNIGGFLSILMILISIIFEFAVDAIIAIVVEHFPNKWFNPDKKIFNVGKCERKFLDFIRTRKWKDHVWELGGLGGFSKKNVKEISNSQYITQFLVESNKGIVIHYVSVIIGFLNIFVLPFEFLWSISIPVAIVNAFLNMLSICVLRYNIPKLKVALKRASR